MVKKTHQKKEYSSKNEVINDLIRQEMSQQNQLDWVKLKLEKAKKSGFTTGSKEYILKQA